MERKAVVLASDQIFRYRATASIIILLFSSQLVYVHGQETATLAGTVLDESEEPIQNAIVEVLGSRYTQYQATTDSSGRFQIPINEEGWYSVYATCDISDTLGVDYVPSLWRTYLQMGSTATFTFILEEGASLYLDGEIRFVESSKPVDYYEFAITDPNGEPLQGEYSVYTYGSGTDLDRRLDFDPRLVVIPSNEEVAISVYAYVSLPYIEHTFAIEGKPGYFKLSQGEKLRIASMEYVVDFNVANMKQTWDSAYYLLRDVEHVGFLVSAESQDLMDAYSLIDASLLSVQDRSYDEAFAKLRRAYFVTKGTIDKLHGLVQISSLSAFLLLPMFAFIASSSAYLVTERDACLEMFSQEKKKISISINLIVSILVYSLMAGTFYFTYPGCRLTNQPLFLASTILFLMIGQVAVILPRMFLGKKSEDRSIQFGSAVVIAFSMACRNLRKRRMRTLLSLSNMMVLVFGFITLTSISTGFGLATHSLPPGLSQHAILIRDRLEGSEEPFLPLAPSFLEWLKDQPNITQTSPKAETIPARDYVWLYTESGERFFVRGILGIAPSAERNFTNIDKVVTGGSYLQDDDLKGILICSSLKETLKVDVGDKLFGFDRDFVVRGFFGKEAMETIIDVDGQLLIPRFIDPLGIIPCDGDAVIIAAYNTSLSLPGVALSRVNVQLKDSSPQQYSEFARSVVLSREYRVFVSHPNSLYFQHIGSYIEEKGTGLIPFLMVLVMMNISLVMLGSVTERKDEIGSLSSVGLNPTHIAALFIAEAAIIGFIGGGLGYLLGILGYRTGLTSWLGALQVREKASAEWGLVALLLSGFTAIFAAVIPALRASTMVTPSLLRRWRFDRSERPTKVGQSWVMRMPVKIMSRELEPLTAFILKRLQESKGADYVLDVSLEEDMDRERRFSFTFLSRTEKSSIQEQSKNELLIKRAEDGDYFEGKLFCFPSRSLGGGIVHKTATYVRKLIFEWNAKEFDVATPFDPSLSQLYTLVNAYNPTSLYIATPQLMIEEKIESLKRKLVMEGLRPPRMVISQVNPWDMEQCMKIAEELVSRVDIVCISGQPNALCTALAVNATLQKKMICYVIDKRSLAVRMKDPFQILRIVDVR